MCATSEPEPDGTDMRAVPWIVFFVFTVSLAAKPAEVELARLETVWNHAHLSGDADALDRICADDLLVTVPGMTVMTKSEALGFLRSGQMKFDRYQTSDTRTRVYGNAAVVTGRLQRSRTTRGRSLQDDWRFTKVYVRQRGRWRVVSFHASVNPP